MIKEIPKNETNPSIYQWGDRMVFEDFFFFFKLCFLVFQFKTPVHYHAYRSLQTPQRVFATHHTPTNDFKVIKERVWEKKKTFCIELLLWRSRKSNNKSMIIFYLCQMKQFFPMSVWSALNPFTTSKQCCCSPCHCSLVCYKDHLFVTMTGLIFFFFSLRRGCFFC